MPDTPLLLRQARKPQRLSKRALAQLVGVHRVTIWCSEQGRSHPLPVIHQSLARVLGCSTDQMAWRKRADDAHTQS